MKKIITIGFLVFTFLPSIGLAQTNDWKREETPHFIFEYKNKAKPKLRPLVRLTEKEYQQMTRRMGFDTMPVFAVAEEKIKIKIYFEMKEYKKAMKEEGETQERFSPSEKHSREMILLGGNRNGYAQALRTQLNRIIFEDYIGHQGTFPSWFKVGWLQTKSKRALSEDHQLILMEMKKGKQISLLQANTFEGDFTLFYSVATSASTFLKEMLSAKKEKQLFELLREGQDFEEALVNVSRGIFKSLDDLNEKWLQYVERY